MPSPILASTARELSSDCWTREGALSRLGLASILSSRSAPSPRSSPRLHGAADVWLPLGLPAGARRRPDLRVLEPRHGSVGPRPRPQVEDELRAARNAPHSHATRHERNRDHAHAYAAGATATDLMTFVVANLDSAATPLSRTLQQTHGERHATNDPNLKIGLAWHLLLRPAGKIVWHNGGWAAIAASSASILSAALAWSCSATTATKTSMTSAFTCWTRRSRSRKLPLIHSYCSDMWETTSSRPRSTSSSRARRRICSPRQPRSLGSRSLRNRTRRSF